MATSADRMNFTRIFPVRGLAVLEAEVRNFVRILRADGRTATATLLWDAYEAFLQQLRGIAQKTAAEAERAIKNEELSSRVRGHGGQGPALGDFIGKSEPFVDVEGSVGVNDERYLEDNGVGWWWTNEFGFSGHIGREIHGLFFPSATPPMSNPLTLDPTFQPGRGGKGVISEPIPDRRFVLNGAASAEADWHRLVRQARARFLADAQRVTQQGRLRAGARRRARP